jgi:hypothetical protein
MSTDVLQLGTENFAFLAAFLPYFSFSYVRNKRFPRHSNATLKKFAVLFSALEFVIYILAHSVCKMRIIQDPKKVAL